MSAIERLLEALDSQIDAALIVSDAKIGSISRAFRLRRARCLSPVSRAILSSISVILKSRKRPFKTARLFCRET